MAVGNESEHPRGTPPTPPPPPSSRYLDWAIRTGFRYQRPGEWIPLLVEFRREAVVTDSEADANAFERFQKLDWLGPAWRDFVKIPETFQKLPAALSRRSNEFDFCVVLVFRKEAQGVVDDAGWRKTIRNAVLGPPLPNVGKVAPVATIPRTRSMDPSSAGISDPGSAESIVDGKRFWIQRLKSWLRLGSPKEKPAVKTKSAQAVGDKRVVIAVLDEGIAFAHERFRAGSASRVEFLWKQDGHYGTPLGLWTPGTELTAADITKAIKDFSAAGRVDEDRLYQREGDVDFGKDGFKALARSRAHGTHVLDLAAGAHASATGLDTRPIIAVELPEAAVADPTGSLLYGHILMGFFYILSRAESMRRPQEADLPVVISLSYGPHDGPHDGTSTFERVVDLLIDITKNSETPLQVVLAAGNFREIRTHARVARLTPGRKQVLTWILQPEDKTPSFLELWARANGNAGADIGVTLTSPGGATWTVSKTIPSDPPITAPLREVQAEYVDESNRVLVSFVAQPTAAEPLNPLGLPLAASGRWTITVQNNGAGALDINAWIGRDLAIGGRRTRGRQSYFDDVAYVRNDQQGRPVEFDPAPAPLGRLSVERSRTLSGIATGDKTHVIGGFQRKPGNPDQPASYSSMGPTAHPAPSRDAATALAPSDDSPTCPGLLASGTRSGSSVTMVGTSVAAPVYARALANQIGLKGAMSFDPPLGVPPGLVKDVAGQGCLHGTPYHDSDNIRKQRP